MNEAGKKRPRHNSAVKAAALLLAVGCLIALRASVFSPPSAAPQNESAFLSPSSAPDPSTPEPVPSVSPTPSITESADCTPAVSPTAEPVPATPGPTPSAARYAAYPGKNLFRIDNAAYESCYYDSSVASLYMALVGKVTDGLKGQTRVYSLIIPTAYGVTLPDEMRAIVPHYTDMSAYIEDAFSLLPDGAVPVRCYDNLVRHKSEYIYFRTDHHWNGTGAYYAYEAFCSAKGITPYTIDRRSEVQFDGFSGTLYFDSGEDQALMPADTVVAYYPYSKSAAMTFYDEDGKGTSWPIVNDVSRYRASAKYSAFAGSDHPLTVFSNPDVTDDSVLIVIKDSFGNALMPLLVDHYSRIYEIDYRYWRGDLVEFAREVGADDLLFANNIVTVTSRVQISRLTKIIK